MEMPDTEVDGTQRLSHLTFKRTLVQSRTSCFSSLFTPVRSELTSRAASQHFSTSHSQFIEPKEEPTGANASEEELTTGREMV